MTNLLAGDSSQYKQIVERRDFYLWFYNAACARGYPRRALGDPRRLSLAAGPLSLAGARSC